jgi:hypothetical protein
MATFLQRSLADWLQNPALRDLGDLATLTYHREHGAFGVDYRKFRAVERVLGHGGPVFLHADFWVASDRPEEVAVDGARVHALDRPAVSWRDGWGASFVRGVFIPDRVRRGEISIADIMCERDPAVRRVMVELFGTSRLLREGDAREIARDGNRALVRVELPGDEPFVALVTPERTLRVPPHVRSCREAEAWTFGFTEVEWT